MNKAVQDRLQPPRVATPTEPETMRLVLILGAAVSLGLLVVWELRQAWAKVYFWPWAALLLIMFSGAHALRRLELWLPGQPVLPRLEAFPDARRRVRGAVWIAGALAMAGAVGWRLWPDYQNLWHGLQGFWLLAVVLVLIGAWLVGSVGKGSPRAATALTMWPDTTRNRILELSAVVLIFALAIFLRLHRLNSVPPGIYVDETNAALDALYILEGRSVSPFATGWYGTPNAYIYYMAGIFKLFGANWPALKAVSLIPAILTIPAVYVLGRLMFGPLAGLSAMLFMAASRWHLSMSRWGWNETAPPLFQVMATFFLIRGLRDRRALDYALSGLLAGLSVYTYLSARLAAATLALYVIFWVVSDPSGLRASLRRSLLGMLILLAAAAVAVAPIAVTYVTDPFTFGNRVSEISIFRDVREQNSAEPLLLNISDILKFFHQTGDHQGKHNLPDEPMADPLTGLFFAIGLAYALLGWHDHRRMLLLLWLVIGLSGSFLSSHHESPQSYRTLTALPAVVLMAGDVLDQCTRACHRTLRERGVAARWGDAPTLAAGAFMILCLSGAAVWESTVYFERQASSIAVARGFNPTENGVAWETINALQSGMTVYLSPNFFGYSPMRFRVYGEIKERSGKNPLEDQPYKIMLPDTTLPLAYDGHDALLLLDREFWPLRDYFKTFYPGAKMELIRMADDDPIYMRVVVAREEILALQGLTERVSYTDGRIEQNAVAQVRLDPRASGASEVAWEGTIRLEHGGQYDLRGEGGVLVFVDGQLWEGRHYLGRGLYALRVVWSSGSSKDVQLIWQIDDGNPEPVPEWALFRVSSMEHGLLGTYWENMNWEGKPLFRQTIPFLLLAWPDEQPVMPNGDFSARYTGMLRVSEPGTYSFRIQADDGARLTLDGNVLGEGLVAGQPNDFDATVELTPGEHPIQVDYFQQGGGSGLRFFWRRGDEPWAPVPPANLLPTQS